MSDAPFAAVVLNFETADPKRDSACATWHASRGAEVVYTDSALIRPPWGITRECHAVRVITWNDAKDQPTFGPV